MSKLGNNSKPFGRSRSPSLPDDIPGLDYDAPAAITCPVCFEIYVEPKLLKCGHTLCLKCVQQLIQNAQESVLGVRGAEFMCPECRQPCSAEFSNRLPTNYRLADVIQQFRAMKTSPKRVEKQIEPHFKCKECQERVKQKQLFICSTCSLVTTFYEDTAFCGACCVKNHNGHRLIGLDQMTTAQERQKVSSNVSEKLHKIQTHFLERSTETNSQQLQQCKSDLLTSVDSAMKHFSHYSGIDRLATNLALTKTDLKTVGTAYDNFAAVYDGVMTQLEFMEKEYFERLKLLKEGFEEQYKNNVFPGPSIDFSFSKIAMGEEPNVFVFNSSKPTGKRQTRLRLKGLSSNRTGTAGSSSAKNNVADASDDDL